MPSPIAHSIAGYVLSVIKFEEINLLTWKRIWRTDTFYVVFISNAPDLDFLIQTFSDEKIHRGFTHSITAALGVSLFAVIASYIFHKLSHFKSLFWVTLMLYSLHLFLDYFTAGGPGMQLLWPFTDEFYRSPVSLFPGVHHSRGVLDWSHIQFVSYELIFSGLLVWGLKYWKCYRRDSKKSSV